ncbi:hypothetical protein ACFPM7_09690 [Actinokineospora guangxiensis]|uniref:PE family protein n=1 Tax=Actinokineospora guangxiensis TaxID=1490288 RepID=A0ABW0EKQ0_9PSEU
MYVDNAAGAGWHVEPEQMTEFIAALEEVSRDLDELKANVAALSANGAQAMLGTSPVGIEMAEKFADRLVGEYGLRGQLDAAVLRMEEFLDSARKTLQGYQVSDETGAQSLRYT